MTTTDAELIWDLILLGIIGMAIVSAVVFLLAVRDAIRLLRRWKDAMR